MVDNEQLLAALDERKSISRYLATRAVRAVHRASQLPWWAFIRKAEHKWSVVGMTVAAKEIEEGKHVTEQAVWLIELDEGVLFARAATVANSPEPTHD